MTSDLLVDNILIDENNKIFFDAANLVLETEKDIVYLTGKAGTGKTIFLKYIKQNYQKNCIVLAPTGIAAVNAGGQTIHSFFKLETTPYLGDDIRLSTPEIYERLRYNKDHISLLNNLSLIIIDEISMVRCDTLDAIDRILRAYRKSSKPFGGIRLLLIGDTFQLPPVADKSTLKLLAEQYDSPHFFSSVVYSKVKPMYIELDKPYRQSELEYIDILNKIRVNRVSKEELQLLNTRVADISVTSIQEGKEEPILLAPTNQIVDNYNLARFNQIKTATYCFEGVVSQEFPEKMMVAERTLNLKIGAQVMILKNKREDQGDGYEYHNGAIGIIDKIDFDNKSVIVQLPQRKVLITAVTWENTVYNWNQDEKICETIQKGTYSQLPLKLAWAITIHKSQGLTFDCINADLASCFDYGQVYVALSRCRKLSGLKLKSPIKSKAIKTDPRVLDFAQTKTPNTLIFEEIQRGKADNLYKKTRDAFENYSFEEMMIAFNEAIKIRDDRNTPLFKKYIQLKFDEYHRNKINTQRLIDQFSSRINDKDIIITRLNQDLEHRLDEYNQLSAESNQENIYLRDKIDAKDVIISGLNKKIEILTTKNSKSSSLLKQMKDSIKDTVLKLSNEKEGLNTKIIRQQEELTNSDLEIQQLRRYLISGEEALTTVKERLAKSDVKLRQKGEMLECTIENLKQTKDTLNHEILVLKEQLSDLEIELFKEKSASWGQRIFRK